MSVYETTHISHSGEHRHTRVLWPYIYKCLCLCRICVESRVEFSRVDYYQICIQHELFRFSDLREFAVVKMREKKKILIEPKKKKPLNYVIDFLVVVFFH